MDTFWVGVALAILIAIMIYMGVHKSIAKQLDDRAAKIQADLDEARRLKEEAEALLAAYRTKQQEAEREAAGIIEGAKAEASRIAAEAKAKMEEFVVRRTRMAENKIAQAEAQAMADVKAAAADAAVEAAGRILRDKVSGPVANGLLEQGIADLKTKLN